MDNFDWDAVSTPVEPQDTGATDPWDAVSTLKPQRQLQQGQTTLEPEPPGSPPRQSSRPDALMMERQDIIAAPPRPLSQGASPRLPRSRGHISMSFLLRLGLFVVVIVGLFAAGHFGLFHAVVFSSGSAPTTATANVGATVLAAEQATIVAQATEQAAVTATVAQTASAAQELYNEVIPGEPVFDDPLSDNRNSWQQFTEAWGGWCAFTGGAYHLGLQNPGYWVYCSCPSLDNNPNNPHDLADFAFQVQMSIVQGYEGGIFFDLGAPTAYRILIDSNGHYVMYGQTNGQDQTLLSGFSPAINTGLNQANVLTVIVYNSNFYFYVNTQFVVGQVLTASSPGGEGFVASSINQTTGTDVAFSNAKAWNLA
jgi:hypothetical protein